jgi:hypothetical protein
MFKPDNKLLLLCINKKPLKAYADKGFTVLRG